MMPSARLLVGLMCCVSVLACGHSNTPRGVFDAYLEAFVDPDAEQLWELSTPHARDDARRVRKTIMAGLEAPDSVDRVVYEGTFGTTAAKVRPLDDRAFFAWAVQLIHRRMGTSYLRRTVAEWTVVRVEPVGAGDVLVVYREPSGTESNMRLRRLQGDWLVHDSPFPKAKPKPPEPKQPLPEPSIPEEPVKDFKELYED